MSVPKRRNRISGQFAARLIEMLELPAYRALSASGHKVISRIEIELGHHGGNDNGRLPVTTSDFVEYGMHRTSVAPAIREAEALGFIRITERGRGGNAEYGTPNLFFLTFSQTLTVENTHLLTIGGASRRWAKQKTLPNRRATTKTRELSSTERGAGASDNKNRKPIRKVLTLRYRTTVSTRAPHRY